MKRTILSIALAVFLLNGYSQEKKETKDEKQVNVPEVVKKAFAKQYPKAADVKWGLEKTNEYEAEFKVNKTGISVVYDEKGTLLETETGINESELPQAVKTTLAKDFASYKINEVEKTESKGSITYEMEAKKDGKEFELVFDKNGKLIKQKEEKEEKD